jgi:hypothetical protein
MKVLEEIKTHSLKYILLKTGQFMITRNMEEPERPRKYLTFCTIWGHIGIFCRPGN